MKVSVSLPDKNIEFLEAYALRRGLGSRSAVLRRAVRLLRAAELGPTYKQAWEEWSSGEEGILWEARVTDGLTSDLDRRS